MQLVGKQRSELREMTIGVRDFAFTAALVCLLAVPGNVAVSAATTDAASSTSLSPASTSLSTLENRLFQLTYQTEDDQARLNRLEKFVFGSSQSGSVQERLSHLQSTLGSGSGDWQNRGKTYPTFDYGNYPRVSQLEQNMLGTTYVQDALPDRLARLEQKAFGKPFTSADLSARVDRLDQYAQRNDIFHDGSGPYSNSVLAAPVAGSPTWERPTWGAPYGQSAPATYGSTYGAPTYGAMWQRPSTYGSSGAALPYQSAWGGQAYGSIGNQYEYRPTWDAPQYGSMSGPPLAGQSVPQYYSPNGASSATDTAVAQQYPANSTSSTSNQPAAPHHSWLHRLGQVLETGAMTAARTGL